MYLLDTNILIYLQKSRFPGLLHRVKTTPIGELAVSTFSVAEMIYGCRKSACPQRNYQALLEFLMPFTIVDFRQEDCGVYGTIRATLEKQGQGIGTIDTFIAAQALSQGHVLVSHNLRDFGRIAGLVVEDWTV